MRDATFAIEVLGGTLAIHDLTLGEAATGAPVVMAVHGSTANGLSWRRVADEVDRRHGVGAVRFLAPDLRGRGASRDVEGPYGLAAHVADLVQAAQVFGSVPVLVGHSMGAFVSALAVAGQPERFAGAVLVDGGLALGALAAEDIDAAREAVIGPAMARLRMEFSGREDYLAFWDQHPAVGPLLHGPAADAVREYLLHDLVEGPEGTWTSSCVLDAVRTDGGDVLADPATHAAVGHAASAGVELDFVWAERGLLDEPQGLYSEDRLTRMGLPGSMRVARVAANHYDVILGTLGVAAVADAIDRQLG